MTDNENKQRRIEDRKPGQPLDWSDAQAEQSSTAGAARQGGNTSLEELARYNSLLQAHSLSLLDATTVYASAYMQDEAEDEDNCVCGEEQHERAKAVFVAIKSLDKVLRAAPVPPLTAPAPLTAMINALRRITSLSSADSATEWNVALNECQAALEAAPVPQQSESIEPPPLPTNEIAYKLCEAASNQHYSWNEYAGWMREGSDAVHALSGWSKRAYNLLRAKAAPAAPVQTADAQRYQRLRILGAAPGGTKQLDAGTVLRFQSLDDFVDADIAAYQSRGEAKESVAAPMQAEQAQAEPIYQASMRGGWEDVEKWQFDLYNDKGDGSIKTRIVYAAPALPAQAEQAAAVRAAYENAIKACEDELVQDACYGSGNTYNSAITHCVAAIRALAKEAAIQAPSQTDNNNED